jgi:hypothetical protein
MPAIGNTVEERVEVQAPESETREQRFLDRSKSSLLLTRKRRTTRRESLIGAPDITDAQTLGHFSKARGEKRRNAAQTWAWLHENNVVLEDQEEANEDEDHENEEERDSMEEDSEELSEGGDAEVDTTSENVADVGSVASSHFAGPRKVGKGPSTDDESGVRHTPKSTARKKQQVTTSAANGQGLNPRRLVQRHSHISLVSGENGPSSANASLLQQRLEDLWRVLDFPFSSKLRFLEKYAQVSDGATLEHALTYWENAAPIVVLREKLKQALAEYEQLKDVKATSRLTATDWAVVSDYQIPVPSTIPHHSRDLVAWIHDNMDAVTQRCESVAKNLKAKTGDILTFQGSKYPPHM